MTTPWERDYADDTTPTKPWQRAWATKDSAPPKEAAPAKKPWERDYAKPQVQPKTADLAPPDETEELRKAREREESIIQEEQARTRQAPPSPSPGQPSVRMEQPKPKPQTAPKAPARAAIPKPAAPVTRLPPKPTEEPIPKAPPAAAPVSRLPTKPLPPPKRQEIPGPSVGLDVAEAALAPFEIVGRTLTEIPQFIPQGVRGWWGILSGEDPAKTVEGQQAIERATTIPLRTKPGQIGGEAFGEMMGLPSKPAEIVAGQLEGHPGLQTAARIGLDPYTYLGLGVGGVGRTGLRPPSVRTAPGPGFVGGLAELGAEPRGRVEPGIGELGAPGGAGEPPLGAFPGEVGGRREPGITTAPRVSQLGGPAEPKVPKQIPTEAKPRITLQEAYERGIAVRPDPGPGIPTQRPQDLPPRPASAPDGRTLPAAQQPLGFTPLDPTKADEITASESIISETRAGGKEGGQQFEDVSQVLHWTGYAGPLDRLIFNAGRAYRTAASKDEAFNNLYSALRNLPPEQRKGYEMFFGPDGQVIPKNDVISRSVEYHTALSTEMNNARAANERSGGTRGDAYALQATPFAEAMRQYRGGGAPPTGAPGAVPARPQADLPLQPLTGERPPVPRETGRQGALPLQPLEGERAPEPISPQRPLEPAKPAPAQMGLEEAPGKPTTEADFDAPIAPAPKPKTTVKQKGVGGIDYNKDSLLAAISKLGGIKLGEKGDLAGQQKMRTQAGGKQVFTKKGKGSDDMAQALYVEGYIPEEEWRKDEGKSFLEEAIRDELGGTRSFYSTKADPDVLYGRMRDEAEGYEPGTFGANPFANPAIIKQAWKDAASVAGQLTRPMRQFFDSVQTTPNSALRAVNVGWNYAREIAAAKEMGRRDVQALQRRTVTTQDLQQDFYRAVSDARSVDPNYQPRPFTTPQEMINATEHARRDAAKWRLQQALLNLGYASPNKVAGFEQLTANIGDLRTRSGKPLYIRKDAHSVIDQLVGAHDLAMQMQYNESFWGKLEAVTHGTTSMIMWNPGFHAFTVSTRAAPFAMLKVKNNLVTNMIEGEGKFRDRDFMYDAMKKGLQPMASRESPEAIGSNMGLVEKWMRKTGVTGKAYDVYQVMHNKVMVDTVNRIQMGVYLMKTKDFMQQGMARAEAEQAAARFANTIAGNLPKEDMGRIWHHVLGDAMFSRSYTSTVTRNVTRALVKDRVLMAQLKAKGMGQADIDKAVGKYSSALAVGLLMDYAAMQVMGNVLNYFTTAMQGEPDRYGNKRGHFSWDNTPRDRPIGSKPTSADYLMPDRIFLGRDDKDKPVYISNPLRTTRDMIKFLAQPAQLAQSKRLEWLSNKVHPNVNLAIESLTGRDIRTGNEIDENAGIRYLERTLPLLPIKTAHEAIEVGSLDYFTNAMQAPIRDLVSTGATMAGLQPHTERGDPTTAMAGKQREAEQEMWAEVRKIGQTYDRLGPEARTKVEDRLVKLAEKKNIDPRKLKEMMQYLGREGAPSGSARKQAGRFQAAPEQQ